MIDNWEALCDTVDELGFLPLVDCGLPDFSVAAMTSPDIWRGHSESNPWEWRYHAVESGRVFYGKFFKRKVAFISLEWFPVFANYRRDGYDFDSLCDDGLAPPALASVMPLFEDGSALSAENVARLLPFPPEKRLDAVITDLMMRAYLAVARFEKKQNRRGEEYGWPISVYATPESLAGAELVRSGYDKKPEESLALLVERCAKNSPRAGEKQIAAFLRGI